MPDSAPSTHAGVPQLAAFALGKLTGPERAALEAHLTDCPACRTALASLSNPAAELPTRDGAAPAHGPNTPTPLAAAAPVAGPPPDLANHQRYEILQLLGQGGMGAVYKARHRAMDRVVALKVITASLLGNRTAVERFHREVQAAAKLHHPHIVTAYDAELAGTTHFLVMEFVKGSDLNKLVKQHGRLPVSEACDAIRQAALGLQHAHEHHMVHRDVKPSNLMRTATGAVKVMDFGLARLAHHGTPASDLTDEHALMGTIDYMAPEQAQDAHQADIRSDIYSLGCTLFYLVAGRPPFPGKTVPERLAGHLTRQPPLAELSVPAGLRSVLAKLLAKQPAQRFQTPAEVALALLPFIEKSSTVPVSASASIDEDARSTLAKSGGVEPALVPADPRGGRQRWQRVGVGALLLLLVGVMAWMLRPAPQPGTPGLTSGETGGATAQPPNGLPQPLPDRAKPFVLTRAGTEVGQFPGMPGALAEMQGGDVIEVHANGPLRLPRVEVTGQSLTIRAAPGYRPRFLPDDSLFDPGTTQNWFTVRDAALAIEGCDFIGHIPDTRGIVFLSATGLGCSVRNCRVVAVYALMGFDGSKFEMEDCLVVCETLGSCYPKRRVLFRNNLVYSHQPLALEAPGRQVIDLQNNTFLPASLFMLRPETRDVTVTATRNVIDFLASPGGRDLPIFPGFDGNAPLADWRPRVRWEGKQNLYRHIDKGGEQLGWPGGTGLAAWNRFLPQAEDGSREFDEALGYAFQKPLFGSRAELEAALRTALEEVRRQSGVADLGPEFTLVGPGDAYVRALAVAGKPVPHEQLRPEALVGGPVVLLRAGQRARGFATLSQAVDQARDGDTIEIRSDHAFAAFSAKGRGTLTVRAAPGYRPIIGIAGKPDEMVADPGTTLILEGLHFRDVGLVTGDDKSQPGAPRGRIARLANCSFENQERWTCRYVALLETADGKPARIANCWLPYYLVLRTWNDARVELSNTVLARLTWLGGPSVLDLDRCLIGNRRLNNTATWDLRDKSKRSVAVRRTWFETICPLIWRDGDPVCWQGSHNHYRVTGPWQRHLSMNNLSGWRQYTGSREEGSTEAATPLLWDPRHWRLLPGSPLPGVGADVDRVAR